MGRCSGFVGLALSMGVWACAPARTATEAGDPGLGHEGGVADSVGDTAGSSAGSASDATTDDGSDLRLDVADEPPGLADEGGFAVGCDKADFVFVIDNSSSMALHQASLIQSVPNFLRTITESTTISDYRILVIDSDGLSPICEEICDRSEDPIITGGPCAGYECGLRDSADPCWSALGAGVSYPWGVSSSNRPCMEPPRNHIESTDPDVDAAFACAARMGTSGHNAEQPGRALVAALTTQAQPGGCQEDFLRDDAILVFTILSDAEPNQSPEQDDDPLDWHASVLTAKAAPSSIVAIGFLGDGYKANPTCDAWANSEKLAHFVEAFDRRGHVFSICQDDYGPDFQQTIDTITETCDEFVPPG